jgi:hypothetical protein
LGARTPGNTFLELPTKPSIYLLACRKYKARTFHGGAFGLTGGFMTASPSTGTPINPGTHLKPGDEAAPGTPGTGEDICPECSGTGKRKDGNECPNCEGTGRIIQAIGGG